MRKRVIVNNKAESEMTKFEKISIGMSGAALLFATVLPVISFFWLDPQFQSFRNRARLQVTPVPRTLNPGDKVDIAYVLTDRDFEIQILNLGNLPAKDVSLALQYGDAVQDSFDVAFNPPLRTEAFNKSNTKFVTFKEAIAPSDKIAVKFIPTPETIWVTNEFGERTILNTRASFEKVLKSAKSIQIYANGEPINVAWETATDIKEKQFERERREEQRLRAIETHERQLERNRVKNVPKRTP